MAVDISGYGLTANLVASNTFPIGILLSQFADDADPLDIPSLQIADAAMGLNGDLIPWSKANPIKANLSVIPGSQDDILLAILLEANRVGKGKTGARDVITLAVFYPNNDIVTLINGTITDGMPNNAVASAGRMKSKTYNLVFENKVGV
jgi:hypothetical protein